MICAVCGGALSCRLKENDISNQTMLVPDTYTLPFPAKLSGPISVKNRMFITDASSPATLDPARHTAKAALVRHLAEELKSSLSTGFDPAVISARIAESGREAEAQDKIFNPSPNLQFLDPVICSGQLFSSGRPDTE